MYLESNLITKKMMGKKLTFIDLFAGCGGLSEGFLQTNKFKALAHVEWEKPMIETLRNRLVNKWGYSKEDVLKRVIHFDIQKTEELINGNWKPETFAMYSKTNHKQFISKGLKHGIIHENLFDNWIRFLEERLTEHIAIKN